MEPDPDSPDHDNPLYESKVASIGVDCRNFKPAGLHRLKHTLSSVQSAPNSPSLPALNSPSSQFVFDFDGRFKNQKFRPRAMSTMSIAKGKSDFIQGPSINGITPKFKFLMPLPPLGGNGILGS